VTAAVGTTWLCSLLSVSSTAAAPLTVTESLTTPTCMEMSTRWRASTSTDTSAVALEKPADSTITV
jgi:hypothetical protein